ncbi:MAG: hypothetical protein AAF436_14055 [Myxococcota bacterium]
MPWNEIATAVVVLVAAGYLYRRFRGNPTRPKPKGGPDVPLSRLKKPKKKR